MSKTKKWALWGAGVGLVIGILETLGIVYCNWNPVEGSIIPMGFCQDHGWLFMPYSLFYLLGYILSGVFDVFGYWGGYIASLIITLITFCLVCGLIGVLLKKIFHK